MRVNGDLAQGHPLVGLGGLGGGYFYRREGEAGLVEDLAFTGEGREGGNGE